MPANTPRGYTYPLYSDPANFPAQIQDLAEDIDADVQGIYDAVNLALNEPSGSVQFFGAQSIPTDVTTLVSFNTELYDNANMVDLGADPTHVVMQVVGAYLITGWIQVDAALSGSCAVLTGATGGVTGTPVAASKILDSVQRTELSVTSLTYTQTPPGNVSLQVRQNSGSPLNLSRAKLVVTRVSP